MMKQAPTYKTIRAVRMRGFSLVSAIFLLIVLAALGVAMVTISTTQHQSSSLDIEGVRAYQAAKAGIEWGVYQQLQNDSCAVASTIAVSGFTVMIACVPGEADTAIIRATACNMPVNNSCQNPTPNNPDYVQRVVEVRL